jgi:hypothetical protein
VNYQEGIYVDRIVDPNSPVVIFRGQTTMEATIPQLMAVLFDPRTQVEWNETAYDTRVVEKKSETEVYFYSAMRVPWPFRDREFLLKLETDINARNRSLLVRGYETVHPGALPHPKRVRVPVSRVNWQLRAIGNRTQVVVTFQLDPGGALPLWIMNKVTKWMPFKALSNIRRVIAQGKYDAVFEQRFARFSGWHN